MLPGYHPYQVLAHVLHEHRTERLADMRDAIRDVLSCSRHQARSLECVFIRLTSTRHT